MLALGHRGVVRVAAYSGDGATLVTGADDRRLHVTDRKTGERIHTLAGLTVTPSKVAISRDGRLVVAAGTDGALHAWRSGRALGIVRMLKGGVRALAVSSDGATVYVADQTRKLRGLDTATWKPTGRVVRLGRGGPIYAAALSTDSETIVVVNAGTGRRVVPRMVRTGRVPIELDALPHVFAVAINDDGSRVVTATAGGQLQLVQFGATPTVKTVDHGAGVSTLALHPSRGLLASGGTDGTVIVWDTDRATPVVQKSIGERAVTALAFSPDGKELTVATADLKTRTLDATSGAERGVVFGLPTGGPPRLAFSGDGRLAAAGGDASIQIWTLAEGRRSLRITAGTEVQSLTFAPTGTLVAAGTDGRLRAFDNDKTRWDVDARDAFVDVSASRKQLAAASSTLGQVRLFDLKTGAEQAKVGGARDGLRAVQFSPDGLELAVGNRRGDVHVYALAPQPRRIRRLLPGRGVVTDLAWRRDGRQLAAAFEFGGLLLYEPTSKTRPPALQRSGMTPLHALAIVDNRLIAGARDGSIRAWSTTSHLPERAVEGRDRTPHWAVSTDARWFAGALDDGSIRVGALAPGEAERLTLFAVGDAWAAWTPKGQYAGNEAGVAWLRIRTDGKRVPAASLPGMRSAPAVRAALAPTAPTPSP